MINKKINFICAGAQKCGTTTLYGLLAQHPSIWIPPQKEIYYFCDERLYNKGADWYEALFENDDVHALKGDITPDYILFPECAKRIYDYNPDVKILIMLRNPADRAFSHYQMKKRDTEENKPFDKALDAEAGRITEGYRQMMKYSYRQRGFYHNQLKPYYDMFPYENIKVLILEEFIKDITGHMAALEEFLSLPEFNDYELPERTNEGYLPIRKWIAYVKRHFVRPFRGLYSKVVPEAARSKIREITDAGSLPKESIPPELKNHLMQEFTPDIKKLEILLSRDLSVWS